MTDKEDLPGSALNIQELKDQAQAELLALHRIVHTADLSESNAQALEYLTLIDSMKMTREKLQKYVGLKTL